MSRQCPLLYLVDVIWMSFVSIIKTAGTVQSIDDVPTTVKYFVDHRRSFNIAGSFRMGVRME